MECRTLLFFLLHFYQVGIKPPLYERVLAAESDKDIFLRNLEDLK